MKRQRRNTIRPLLTLNGGTTTVVRVNHPPLEVYDNCRNHENILFGLLLVLLSIDFSTPSTIHPTSTPLSWQPSSSPTLIHWIYILTGCWLAKKLYWKTPLFHIHFPLTTYLSVITHFAAGLIHRIKSLQTMRFSPSNIRPPTELNPIAVVADKTQLCTYS